jgi:TolB protein
MMMVLKGFPAKTRRRPWLMLLCLTVMGAAGLLWPGLGCGKIYIDISSPYARKLKIAIPDFSNGNPGKEQKELAVKLPEVISNDLDLSGYFAPMDKRAFLEPSPGLRLEEIRFKDWSVIGTELLLTGKYVVHGNRLEVEVRLFDVFYGRQLLGKRALGDVEQQRYLMHRLADEIIRALTGEPGIFSTKVSFVGTATGQKEIYTADYDGFNLRQITTDKSIALLPRWSPDGQKLMFVSYRGGGGPVLYMKEMDSGTVKRISAREGLNIGASWSPDGTKLATTLSADGNPDIYTIDPGGRILERLTNHWGIDVSPTFSPDGKKVAFVSNRAGSPQIYVRDLAGGTEERITFDGNYNTSPSWSSLNRIAYTSMNQGRFDIFSINSDGTQPRQLTEDQGNNEDACWSPDGRYIMFSSNREGGAYHLYMMTANGQNQRRISFLKGQQTSPSWSR